MKKNKKLYFVDLDGTALDIKQNNHSWISETNINAIQETRAQGHEVIISTGRHSSGLEKFIEVMGGRYSVMSNGAQILDNKSGKFVKNEKLSKKSIIKIVDFARKHKLLLRIPDEFVVYGCTSFLRRYITKKFKLGFQHGYNLDIQTLKSKVLLWGSISRKKMNFLKDELNKNIENTITVQSGKKGLMLEITKEGSTKGTGNEKVAKLLKTDKKNTIHIGDSMNDFPAIKHVGKFIAMKNSDKSLKMEAKNIGPHYKNGGLAKILLNNQITKKS